MASMIIETELTPNPATIKFLPGRFVMESGTRDFADPEEAEASPLAQALFGLGDVSGVFFGKDFVSVTAAPGVNWSDLKPDVLSVLLDHFSADMPLFHAPRAGFSVPAADTEYPLDDPADGDIVYRGFQRGVVFLQMQGACSGCPSSSATLKNGIEQLLKHYVPEVTEVRAA
jgi:hypothetical protein